MNVDYGFWCMVLNVLGWVLIVCSILQEPKVDTTEESVTYRRSVTNNWCFFAGVILILTTLFGNNFVTNLAVDDRNEYLTTNCKEIGETLSQKVYDCSGATPYVGSVHDVLGKQITINFHYE